MSIGAFLVILAAWAFSSYVAFALVAMQSSRATGVVKLPERDLAAIAIAVPTAIALAFRSADFGVDTLTYMGLYQQYCFVDQTDFDSSYLASFGLVRVASFGACAPQALVPVWTALIVLGFLLLPIDWASRFRLLALGLVSLVGIELATNAFRQGLAAAVLMVGVLWFERRRIVGAAILVASIALHSSSALVVAAFFLSLLPWRWYLLGLAVITVAALNYTAFESIGPIQRLIYEITKYSIHEADDFWIRVIAATQLAALIMIAYLAKGRTSDVLQTQGDIERNAGLAAATKLALTALPYLPMPYFGYRYVYGIYFVVLVLARRTFLDDRKGAFEMLLLANILIALAWAFGSSTIAGNIFLEL